MFDLFIGFDKPSNLWLFLLLFVTNTLWIFRSLKRKSQFGLTPFVIINVLLFICWGLLVGIDTDESEHLHCAWMVARGLVPFRDFWQHHSPLLWIILAPFFKLLKPTVFIFELSRIFSGILFLVNSFLGWQIAKSVWREKARLPVYLLILFSSSILGEFFWLRPDLFMEFFLLVAIYFTLELTNEKRFPAFFAGISFALAASFIFKQYLLFLLPIIVIYIGKNKFSVVKLLMYLAGLVIGITPLIFYLARKEILSKFIFWVFKFNQERIVVSVIFPIAIGFMGTWGAYALLKRYFNLKDLKPLILSIAFCLSTLSSLTATENPSGGYYLSFWYFLCAISGSGCNIMEMVKKTSSLIKRSIALGLFFSLLLMPNIMYAKGHRKTYLSEDKRVISKLIKYCAGDRCLVLLPLHPVFSFDATRLYSDWQYYFVDSYPSVRKDAKNKNIVRSIINERPAVVLYSYQKKYLLLDLFLKGLISKEDYKILNSLFNESYTTRCIGGVRYYIRNDKLQK